MERFVENRGDYLYLKLSGHFNIHELQPRFPVLLKMLIEERLSKVLIDCREMSGSYSRADRYYINHWLADLNIEYMHYHLPQLKITSVLTRRMFDPEKFGEKLAMNRGLQVHNTMDIEDAYQWLGVAPVEVPASDNRPVFSYSPQKVTPTSPGPV